MKLFGTDGIRGKAGLPPLDPPTIARIGSALVYALDKPGGKAPRVLLGRDTRESGEWMEAEIATGLSAEGADVVSVGIVPTPAIALLTNAEGFHAGVMLSASHNPFDDNGIKVFSGRGEKLDAEFEARIEARVADERWHVSAPAARPRDDQGLIGRYVTRLERILPAAGPLTGSRIVVDCANGATATLAPRLFRQLGFDVVALGVTPDGRNINDRCGSTHLSGLRQTVLGRSAMLGIAFDGDGDRALFVDHEGRIVDGDAVLLFAAEHLKEEGRLPNDAVVATVMSNVGLEIALRERGIELVRAAVGDKYVMETMTRRGLALGGEQSGHIIFADHLYTGDGIGTALQVLRIMIATGRELSDLAARLVAYPQVLVNVRVRERADYLGVPAIAESIARVEQRLHGQGRLLIRYSGTEPLLRIMLEGKDDESIRAWADEIADAVRGHLS